VFAIIGNGSICAPNDDGILGVAVDAATIAITPMIATAMAAKIPGLFMGTLLC
jgi:hypothetical protein